MMLYRVTFDKAGRVTVDCPPNTPVPSQVMAIMAELAGDNPIGYSECLSDTQIEDLARRLAQMILAEVA